MARIGVQSEDLHHQSSQVRIGADNVSTTLDQLSTEIAALAGSWQGLAADAFQAHWTEWQAGAKQVQLAMENMGKFLQEAAALYEANEEQLRSAAAR